MRRIRRVMIGTVTGALLLTSSPADAQLQATPPEHLVAPGSAATIDLGGGGKVVFPDNARRTQPIGVDVSQSAPRAADVGTAAGGGERILGDIVTVTAQDASGTTVTTLPYQVSKPDAAQQSPAVAAEVVPGVELTIPVSTTAVAGRDPNDVALYSRPGPGARWTELPSALRPDIRHGTWAQ